MATFQIGETVICSITVKNDAGVLTDPASSMKITITDPRGNTVVASQDMVKDSTGMYHYDYLVASAIRKYTVIYTATDGSRITIVTDSFEVETP